MAYKTKTDKPADMAIDTEVEKVGYKRPPKKSQFKKGESGNPKGRPKQPKTLEQAVFEAIHKPKTVIANGKPTKMAGIDVLASKLTAGAIELKRSAMNEVITIVKKVETEQAAAAAAAAAAEKQAIETPPFSWDREEEELYAQLKEMFAESTREEGHDQE